ncbi:MAG: alpha/beta hydrolase [Dehalococcoidia bacterium]|nr:alpha/beta hydrolase [Dehalococcoidia bacterium]
MTEGRVELREGVLYGRGGGRELKCDVFIPPGKPTNAPGLFVIHGGSWRSNTPAVMRGYGFLFGRDGYVVVMPEYRLSGEAQWPAQMHDLKAALRWMHANAAELGVDPGRIAVLGNSAGGHLALMMAGTRNTPKFDGTGGSPGASADCAVVINLYGITSVEPDGDFLQDSLKDLLGPNAGRDVYREASPVEYVDEHFPPTCTLQSREDLTVPPAQSWLLYEALQRAGVTTEIHMYDRIGHQLDETREVSRQVVQISLLFLQRFMGPAAVAVK